MSPSDWSWSPEAVAGLVVAGAYAATRRRFPAPAWRRACFLAGCVLLVLAWASPLDTLARHYLLLAHLGQNVVLAEWAPLLLVLGLSPALAAAVARPRTMRVLVHPFAALPLWLGNYALWHVPALYDEALRRPHSLLLLEHLLYLLTGLLLWWPVWQDAPRRISSQGRAGYVFAGFVLSAPLGLVLALVPSPIYDFYAAAPERLWGLTRIADQQFGGIVMASEQSIVFFAVFAYWLVRFLAEEDRLDYVDAVSGR
ncbi:putative membrane protein [Gaiella occulta]|uniref:Putative membrane protein n=1 Tax=Gaiella occulta TaxID=1002870 RepID=A0A7M2YWM7_9ACTN|nr:cytochrome c oxidase assembly protein [Gaiella occulta]RDI74533.1 putative membrane protein [Gaiella occulta]